MKHQQNTLTIQRPLLSYHIQMSKNIILLFMLLFTGTKSGIIYGKFQQSLLLLLLPWSLIVKSGVHGKTDSRDWAPISQHRSDRRLDNHEQSHNNDISSDHYRNREMYGQYAAYNFGGFGVFRIMQTDEDETRRKGGHYRNKYDNNYEKRLKDESLANEGPLIIGDILRFNITEKERITPISRTKMKSDLNVENSQQQQDNKAVYDMDDYEKQNDVDVIDWD